MSNIRKLVNALPGPHKALLVRLGTFLLTVAQHSEVGDGVHGSDPQVPL